MADVIHPDPSFWKRGVASGGDSTAMSVQTAWRGQEAFILYEMPVVERLASINELYPLSATENPQLDNALSIASNCGRLIDEALDQISSDVVAADLLLQQLHALVCELFCCRRLSDGFGMIVGSLCTALHESATEVPSEAQLQTLKSTFRSIGQRPFLGVESALDEIEALEKVGFEIQSEVVSAFLDVTGDGE